MSTGGNLSNSHLNVLPPIAIAPVSVSTGKITATSEQINTAGVAGVEALDCGGTGRGGTGAGDFFYVDINPIMVPDSGNVNQPMSLLRLRDRGSATNGYLLVSENNGGGEYPVTLHRNGNLRLQSTGVLSTAQTTTALLEVNSTVGGIRFPRMTTAQKNAIANTSGLVIFDTDLGKLCVNTGSGWQTITSA